MDIQRRKHRARPRFVLAVILTAGLAISLFSACDVVKNPLGLEGEALPCPEVCTKMRNCHPSLSDKDFDGCIQVCRNNGWGNSLVDCLDQQVCDDGFETILTFCLDPEGELEGDGDSYF